MKGILLLLMLICSISAFSTTYQIADQTAYGSFNWSSLVAGDVVQLATGQTFYGAITLTQSGSSGNVITITSYGTGANPIISGFTTVSAWTDSGGNIWESTSAVSALSTCNMVTVGGINTAMGRIPNADATWGGYYPFQSHSGLTSITSSSLTGTPNWTGAEIRIRNSSWTFGKSIITSQSGSTLTFGTLDGYEPTDDWGFFLQNDIRTLDALNEWYYNPSTKKISIYKTSQPTNVKVASVDNLITVNGDYITFSGIDFTGANNTIIYTASTTIDHITISGCSILYAGNAAMQLRCAYLDIQNNTIAYANNKGIALDYCSNVTFKNNNVHDISVLQGMGKSGNGTFSGLNGYYQSNVLIEGNTFTSFGGAAIEVYGDNVTVKNNVVDTYGFVIEDLGGIYTYVGAGTPFTMVKIEGNIVLNGIGAISGTYYVAGQEQANGIYLDDNSNNVEVFNNTVANCSAYGFYLHNTNNVNFHNNTSYNNSRAQIHIKDDANGGVVASNLFNSNIFVSKISTQRIMYCYSSDNNISTFGTFTSNYYSRPISESSSIYVNQPSTGLLGKNLSEWKTFSGQDANSSSYPQTINSTSDFQFIYNTTGSTVPSTISFASIDVTGTKYTSPVSLLGYSSKVLIKDTNPNIPSLGVRQFGQGKHQWKF